MDRLDFSELEGIYREIETDASRILASEGVSGKAAEMNRSLDICYEGQRYYIDTPVPGGELNSIGQVREKISDSFRRLYEMRYGHLMKAPLEDYQRPVEGRR